MFTIGKNFHIIHMTDDLDELDAWYDDVFGVLRFMNHQYADVLKRDASLVLVGDLCIEPMAPAFREPGWEKVALGRFFNRFGKRWHSIAWYTGDDQDMVELYQQLVSDNIRVYGGTGNPSQDGPPPGALFTHPADTYTQLEFMAPNAAMSDPRFHGSFDPAWWSNQHPLGIRQSSHVTVTVLDLPAARDRYVRSLGGTLLFESDIALTQTRSAFVALGDLVVELAQPVGSDSPIAADMERHHQSLYAVTFQVRELEAARRYLESKAVTFTHEDGNTLLTDPTTTHGVVFGFTTWEIPNDLRPRR
jgi:catechol 2,3-dioxygenase-like lactoylglutathione lyase family enzyme